jgi:hypothetical protein
MSNSKLLSVSSTGRIRRTIIKKSTDERILELHRLLGLSGKQAAREYQYLVNVKIQSRFATTLNNI